MKIGASGIIPQFFWEEEARVLKVSPRTKKYWAVLLDLFLEFDRVCRKHNIKYVVHAGTILGAVRHKGFIPWDDDIDVMITREEYERLCLIADKEFQDPYFFQTPQSEPDACRGHAQLRNSQTTAILKSEMRDGKPVYQFNQGVFLDVFVLDKIPDSPDERSRYFVELQGMKNRLYWLRSLKYGRCDFSFSPIKFLRWSLLGFRKFIYRCNCIKVGGDYLTHCVREFDVACRRYEKADVKCVSHLSFAPNPPEKYIFDLVKFSQIRYEEFEMIQVPIPDDHEYFLKKLYGNWHEHVVGSSVHGGMLIDVDRPYTEYLK